MTHVEKLMARVRNRKSYEGLPGMMSMDECVPPISWPKKWLQEAFDAAVEEERVKWMLATAHDHTCAYIKTPSPPCNCGAHARLAELQAEGARTIRARGEGG